ncbi:hypothetical protein [Endozoicomonas ascidiicola]|uniref:hypothetical protein n=1 Tax=Endozoicomonas ascidiicola TaxID=1698521 RepID=UPI000A5624D8|nr:hypothetical protein [Endozoicomonas ascidiicola]
MNTSGSVNKGSVHTQGLVELLHKVPKKERNELVASSISKMFHGRKAENCEAEAIKHIVSEIRKHDVHLNTKNDITHLISVLSGAIQIEGFHQEWKSILEVDVPMKMARLRWASPVDSAVNDRVEAAQNSQGLLANSALPAGVSIGSSSAENSQFSGATDFKSTSIPGQSPEQEKSRDHHGSYVNKADDDIEGNKHKQLPIGGKRKANMSDLWVIDRHTALKEGSEAAPKSIYKYDDITTKKMITNADGSTSFIASALMTPSWSESSMLCAQLRMVSNTKRGNIVKRGNIAGFGGESNINAYKEHSEANKASMELYLNELKGSPSRASDKVVGAAVRNRRIGGIQDFQKKDRKYTKAEINTMLSAVEQIETNHSSELKCYKIEVEREDGRTGICSMASNGKVNHCFKCLGNMRVGHVHVMCSEIKAEDASWFDSDERSGNGTSDAARSSKNTSCNSSFPGLGQLLGQADNDSDSSYDDDELMGM